MNRHDRRRHAVLARRAKAETPQARLRRIVRESLEQLAREHGVEPTPGESDESVRARIRAALAAATRSE
jgi:hypothetical protein